MKNFKRTHFWIDPPLQLQIVGTILILVSATLLIVAFSVLRGLEDAAAQSQDIFHSMEWIRASLQSPLIIASCLSLGASALIALVWSHRMAGPLRVMAAAIARLSQGNFTTPLRIRSGDAHQQLAKEFCDMQETLRNRIKQNRNQLEDFSRRLEEASAKLPKDHQAREELQAIAQEIKNLDADYQL